VRGAVYGSIAVVPGRASHPAKRGGSAGCPAVE